MKTKRLLASFVGSSTLVLLAACGSQPAANAPVSPSPSETPIVSVDPSPSVEDELTMTPAEIPAGLSVSGAGQLYGFSS